MEENGRVVGVRAEADGQEHTVRARLVVGADGRRSTVANLVGAEEYLTWDAPRAAYWGYWEAPTFWKTDPAYSFGMYVANTHGDVRLIFPTDDDQLLISSAPPLDQIGPWRENPEAALRADLASDPVTSPLIDGTKLDGGRARDVAGLPVFEHQISPYDAFPVPKLLGWTIGGALRGHPGVIAQFLAMGRHVSAIKRELKARKRLLEESMRPGVKPALAAEIEKLVSGF